MGVYPVRRDRVFSVISSEYRIHQRCAADEVVEVRMKAGAIVKFSQIQEYYDQTHHDSKVIFSNSSGSIEAGRRVHLIW